MENAEGAGKTSKSNTTKILLLVVIFVLLVAAGVGGYMFLGKKGTIQNQMSQAAPTQTAPLPTSGNMITSIRDALMGSQSLQCNFTDEEGRKIVSYVKNGAIRSDVTASDPKQSGSMIFKDKKMYFWNGSQGTEMNFDMMAMMDSITPVAPQTTPVPSASQNPQDFVASMEKYKKSCKSATVSDALFVPPSGVKFTDVSSMMKAAQSAKAMPSAMPSAMSQEQIKALQQKYQQ